jgi:hypothetical protein
MVVSSNSFWYVLCLPMFATAASNCIFMLSSFVVAAASAASADIVCVGVLYLISYYFTT